MHVSLIPVFTRIFKNKDIQETKQFISVILSNMMLFSSVIILLMLIFSKYIGYIVAPGFFIGEQDRVMLVSNLNYTMFPFFIFITLASIVGGILNVIGYFFLPAIASCMLSVSEIVYLFIVLPQFQSISQYQAILGLGISVSIGGLLHLLIQMPLLLKWKLIPRLHFNFLDTHFKTIIKCMFPVMIGVSIQQIGSLIDMFFASFLQQGSISVLYNANRVLQFPIALIGISLTIASLPSISKFADCKNWQQVENILQISLKLIIFFIFPCSIGLLFLAYPICSLLFEYGQFQPHFIKLTSIALSGYSIGLIGYCVSKSILNVYYALHKHVIGMIASLICLGVNIILNIIFVQWIGLFGLAFATACSGILNACFLILWLKRIQSNHVIRLWHPSYKVFFLKVFICNMAMILVIVLIQLYFQSMPVLFIICIASMVYISIAYYLKMEQSRIILNLFNKKHKT